MRVAVPLVSGALLPLMPFRLEHAWEPLPQKAQWQQLLSRASFVVECSAVPCAGHPITGDPPASRVDTTNKVPYSLLIFSDSPAVANPGSVTTNQLFFPDGETMNCRCRSDSPGFTIVDVPVQSGFTEYVPEPARQPGVKLPLSATASTEVKFPSPSYVVLTMPSITRTNPFGRKSCPCMALANVPLRVALLQARA